MGEITLRLPWPPSVNHYYCHSRKGVFLSADGKRFRKRTVALLGPREPLLGPLKLSVELYPPDKRRRDADNSLKSVQDALQHGNLYRDDCQIYELHVYKHAPHPPLGEIIVKVEPLCLTP